MDLGIKGKKALVCGASAGLGHACAEALGHTLRDIVAVTAAHYLRESRAELVPGRQPAEIRTQ